MNDALNPSCRPRRGAVAVLGAAVSGVLITSVLVLGNPTEVQASGLARFTSCEALSAWGAQSQGRMRFETVGSAIEDSDSAGMATTTRPASVEAMAPEAGPEGAGEAADQSTSGSKEFGPVNGPSQGGADGTNVVVEGIDEPDVVERLGEDRALVVGSNVLAVVDLAAGVVESRASVPSGAQVTYDAEAGVAWSVANSPEGAVLVQRFVVASEALTLDGEWSTPGMLVSARRDGGELLVVATDGFATPATNFGTVGSEIDAGGGDSELVGPVAPSAGEDPNGTVTFAPDGSSDREVPSDVPSTVPFGDGPVPCDAVLHPDGPSEPTATLLAVFPVTGELTPVRATEVVGAGRLVHVTHDAAYLATPRWDAQTGAQSTGVHRFDLESLTHTGSGQVDGSMLNDFSMSEHEGFLRVAVTAGNGATIGRPMPMEGPITEPGSAVGVTGTGTTEPSVVVAPSEPMPVEPAPMPTVVEPEPSGDILNEVVVLDTVGDLDVVGRTPRFGHPGETLRGIRFDGEVAYGVTFLTTDPFYVLDLADPAAPRVQGEVELPGFSSYLHPISAQYVVGFGPDEIGHVAAKLFDVSDRSQPRVVDAVVLGDDSPVTFDHHAFVSLGANRFAVPASAWSMGGGGCDPTSCRPSPPCDPAACDSIAPPVPAGVESSVVVIAVTGGRLVVEQRHSVVLDEAASRVIPTADGWGLLTSAAVTLVDNAGNERATVTLR